MKKSRLSAGNMAGEAEHRQDIKTVNEPLMQTLVFIST